LANMTTTRSPLKNEPGWTAHTANQKFGKVEYFRDIGLTEGDTVRSRSPDERSDIRDPCA
ncbi:hypothetical protein, partial [Bradyrhizobium sp. CCH5-F6]|uniref:hypothetical protein n=1 Tax=Bradyrhizobium sp. CCH5-F6 TaxID=1768753 RepID=UPI001AECA0FB